MAYMIYVNGYWKIASVVYEEGLMHGIAGLTDLQHLKYGVE